MKKVTVICAIVMLMVSVIAIRTAAADDPIPITADEAFDAIADQKDPDTGEDAMVKLVDIRSAAEHYWVGTCAKVKGIWTTNDPDTEDPNYVPEHGGKVKLILGGRLVRFRVSGHTKLLLVKNVAKIETLPIAINIPYKTWNDDTCEKPLNYNFGSEIEALKGEDVVIILMCRSGKRSTECVDKFETTLFKAVYEIDQPDGKDGRGGFQGTSYDDAYNGYRGFPERTTRFQEHKSVSWSDTRLPTHIGWCDGD